MKFVHEFRDETLAGGLVERIHSRRLAHARLMEFCGGHTASIQRYGLRQLMPGTVTMISGPGCPVCVTANADLDRVVALAERPGTIVATFGDVFKIPAGGKSLEQACAEKADGRIVYSPLDALKLAVENPKKQVVFIGVGFETTAPAVGASILEAEEEGLENYYVLSLHKVCPPITCALLRAGEMDLQGLICPGHVSAIIGAQAWAPIAEEFHLPCVVAGFEPLDILLAVDMILAQLERGESKVEIAYRRGVQYLGNPVAQGIIEQVFEPCAAIWRGIGEVPESGLRLREAYRRFDAAEVFDLPSAQLASPEGKESDFGEPKGCICGEILRGAKTPKDCLLFGKRCVPENPVGPCMVSAEGGCNIFYTYGDNDER